MLPLENIDTIQDALFILEHELKQPEDVILEMPYWIIKKRLQQWEEMKKREKEGMDKANQGIKK